MPPSESQWQINCCLSDKPQDDFRVYVERCGNVDDLKVPIREARSHTLAKDLVEDFQVWKVRYAEAGKHCH
jgi:hypothetical protein